MFYNDNRAQQEEERFLFFPGNNSVNEELRTCCLLESSPL